MNRIELFESLGFKHMSTYQNGSYEIIHSFKRTIDSPSEGWAVWLACTSFPNRTNWYYIEEGLDGDLGISKGSTFETIFELLTDKQQETAVWHLDILK